MADGMVLAVGAMLCYGLADWVYKRAAASGIHAHHFMMLQAFFFAPAVVAYGLASGTLVPGPAFAWGMAAGGLIFVALYNFAKSLGAGAVTVVVPVFRLSFALTAALAIGLLGEPLTAWKAAGLVASLLAVWLLLAGGEGDSRGVTRRGLLRVAVATVAMGVVNFLYKVGADAGGSPATVIAGQASVFMPFATAFAIAQDRGFRPPAAAWRYGAVAAVLLLLALVMLVAALARGEASVLVPIAQLSFVVTAVLGYVVLRERVTWRGAWGLACAAAALACLAQR